MMLHSLVRQGNMYARHKDHVLTSLRTSAQVGADDLCQMLPNIPPFVPGGLGFASPIAPHAEGQQHYFSWFIIFTLNSGRQAVGTGAAAVRC